MISIFQNTSMFQEISVLRGKRLLRLPLGAAIPGDCQDYHEHGLGNKTKTPLFSLWQGQGFDMHGL